MGKKINYIFNVAEAIVLMLFFGCTSGNRPRIVNNAIINGGFETEGEKLQGWDLKARHSDKELPYRAAGEPSATIMKEAHSGKNSLHVLWDMPDYDSWNSLWTLTNNALYSVKPGDEFTVTAWMRGTTGYKCGKVWMEVLGLKDNKIVKTGIGKDMLNARSYWLPFEAKTVVPEGCNQMQVRFTGGHRTDLFLDDVQVYAGPPSPYKKLQKPLVTGFMTKRVREKLNRGIVALPVDNKEVYLSWRLLDTDSSSVAFNIYRVSDKKVPVLLNDKPLKSTTDFTDKTPVKKGASSYFVRTILNGVEGISSENADVTLPTVKNSYISIKLNGDYSATKAGVGDLNGDGQFEYVVKTPKVNFDPWIGDERKGRGYWQPSKETYKLEAYRLDGTLMWRYDMGWSIETGEWFSPFIIYDLDGDGCAEIAVKAGEGDPRQSDGHVISGPEYLVILNGRSGKEIARTDWIPREGYDTDESMNRNQLCVAYLDGKTPCILDERGTYDITAISAYMLQDGQIKGLWKWNDRDEEGLSYTGLGAHCIHAADIDDDGRDEIIFGAAALDDNGTGLWTQAESLTPRGGMYGFNSGSGRGHTDHCVVGEFDPAHPGLEVYFCYEPGMEKNGICQVDAKTGKILWGTNEKSSHYDYGLIADLDPANPGVEIWGGEADLSNFWFLSAQGKVISKNVNTSHAAAFWNADLQREYFFREDNRLIQYSSGLKCGPEFPGSPLLVADVFGDWREEIILAVPGELRIYSTTIPATDRRVTLLRDPIYRLDVCQESQAYLSIPAFSVNPH